MPHNDSQTACCTDVVQQFGNHGRIPKMMRVCTHTAEMQIPGHPPFQVIVFTSPQSTRNWVTTQFGNFWSEFLHFLHTSFPAFKIRRWGPALHITSKGDEIFRCTKQTFLVVPSLWNYSHRNTPEALTWQSVRCQIKTFLSFQVQVWVIFHTMSLSRSIIKWTWCWGASVRDAKSLF